MKPYLSGRRARTFGALLVVCAAGCAQIRGNSSHALSGSTSASVKQAVDKASLTTAPDDIADAVQAIDHALAAHWATAGVSPGVADDATYLRRVYLDLAGRVPSANEARRFIEDGSPSKRAELVDTLLASNDYARHWTNYWDGVLMGQPLKRQFMDRMAFRKWLYGEIADNTPYDELAYQVLSAKGVNSEGGRRDPNAWDLDDPADAQLSDEVNGAVNWLLRGAEEPQNVAGAAARTFLGVQIQCAECHDHPTEAWTQDDFKRFTAAFMRTSARRIDKGKVRGVRRMDVFDIEGPLPRAARRRFERTGYDAQSPTAIDGTKLDQGNPREALARWMTNDANPWFTKAVVNRLWSTLLGSGFTDPIDDWRKDQDIVAEDVFNALANDFSANGHDLKHLLRVICATRAYQSGSSGGAGQHWHSFAVRPMDANQLLDSVVTSAQLAPLLEQVAGERLAAIKMRVRRDFNFTFDTDGDSAGGSADDGFSGTVPQALLLLNGAVVDASSSGLRGSTLHEAVEMDERAAIEHLHLAALSRMPSSDELAYWQKFLAETSDDDVGRRRSERRGPVGRVKRRLGLRDSGKLGGYEDMFWVLLNSNEFYFIH